jgi:tetratricopeptide (TPR) repeat protein
MAKCLRSCLWYVCVLIVGVLPTGCASTGIDQQLMTTVSTQQAAELAYAKGDWPQALVDYQSLVKQQPKQAEYWFRLGNVQFRQGQPDAATESYLHAVQLDPKLSAAWFNLGIVRLRQSQAAFVQAAQVSKSSDPLQQGSISMVDGISRLTDAKAGQADPQSSTQPITTPAKAGGT